MSLGYPESSARFSTDISDPAAVPTVDYSAYFLLAPVWY
jgi:hypothetical protein